MDKILYNIALYTATNFCKEQSIDCSGTYLFKKPRKWTYTLIRETDKRPVVSVSFYNNQVPTFAIHTTK